MNSQPPGRSTALDENVVKFRPNLSQSHQKLQLELHTTGTYGVRGGSEARLKSNFERGDNSRTEHRRFDRIDTTLSWAPWTSGSLSGWLQTALVVAAIACHTFMMSRAGEAKYAALCSLGPPILAVVFARLYLFLITQEQTRVANKPSAASSLQRSVVFLRIQLVLVFVVIAPLLCIPVRITALYVDDTQGVNAGHDWLPKCSINLEKLPEYLLESSMEAIYSPGNFSFITDPDVHLSLWPTSLDPTWQLLPADHRDGLALGIEFADDADDTTRRLWLRGRAKASYVHHVPLDLPPVGYVPSNLITTTQKVNGGYGYHGAIAGCLLCQLAQISSDSSDVEGFRNSSATVQVIDTDGCSTSFKPQLDVYTADDKRRFKLFLESYAKKLELHALSNQHDTNLQLKMVSFRPLLKTYISSLDSTNPLTSTRPRWLLGGKSDADDRNPICQRKLMIVVPSIPFTELNKTPQQMLQAASCVTDLFFPPIANVQFQVVSWISPFRKLHPKVRQTLTTYRPQDPLDKSRYFPDRDYSSTFTSAMDKFLAREVIASDVFEPWYSSQLIEYEFAALGNPGPETHYAFAYAADQLLSKIFRGLALAAGTAPRSCTSVYENPHPISQGHVYLESQLWQKYFLYRSTLFVATIMLLFCILCHHSTTDQMPSGIPWRVSSIATRASLLCHSRLRKCLRPGFSCPENFQQVQPIEIGLWSSSKEIRPSEWRADSLLNHCKTSLVTDSTEWLQHSYRSLPAYASPLHVICASIVLAMFAASSYLVAKSELLRSKTMVDGSSLVPIKMGTNTSVPHSLTYVLFVQFAPIMISIALSVYWWSALILFYKLRLPWAALSRPCLAAKSVTLDYTSRPFPILEALRNKHWMLTFLMIGSFLMLTFPILVSRSLELGWTLESVDVGSTSREWDWDGISFRSNETTSLKETLQDTIIAWHDSSLFPKWSSFRESLAAIDTQTGSGTGEESRTSEGHARLWRFQSSSIRAEMQCSSMGHKLTPTELNIADYQSQPTFFKLDQGVSSGPLRNLVLDPCYEAENKNDLFPTFCSRWQLVNSHESDDKSSASSWIISTIYRNETNQHANVYMCQPKIFLGTGVATLMSRTGSLRDTTVHTYNLESETPVSGTTVQKFNLLLNGSAFTPEDRDADRIASTVKPGLRFKTPILSSEKFRGDILSLLAYRELIRNEITLDNTDVFMNLTSLTFSSIFSVAAQKTDLFKSHPSQPEATQLIEVEWHETFRADALTFRLTKALLLILLFTMIIHTGIMVICKEYRFPIAPEALENSWFFLYRSRLVDAIEQKISNPHKLSLLEFHRRINKFGQRYVFARDPGNASWNSAQVDFFDDASAPTAYDRDAVWEGADDDSESVPETPLEPFRDEIGEDEGGRGGSAGDIPLLRLDQSSSWNA